MTIIFATHNANKVKELNAILSETPFKVLSLDDVDYHKEIIEDGAHFVDNAAIKAHQVYKDLGLPTLADDSGLCVDAMDGAPGVHSARFGGIGATSEEKNELLLMELEGVPLEERGAHYTCCFYFIKDEMESFFVEKDCYGVIGFNPVGKGGFGYDPLFYLPEYNKTMAELSMEEKNKISHRGKATREFVEKLYILFEGIV